MVNLWFSSSVREFLQINPSHLWKKHKRGKRGVTDVGGGLLTALTAVRDGGLSEQEMTWPPLWETGPPQQNPHCSGHPGSPQEPTEAAHLQRGGTITSRQQKKNKKPEHFFFLQGIMSVRSDRSFTSYASPDLHAASHFSAKQSPSAILWV